MNILLFILKIKNSILDILLPIKCFNCQAKNEIFCLNCIKKTKFATKNKDDNFIVVFDYKDPIIKKAIWELKYFHRLYLGKKLGQIMYNFLREEISFIKKISSNKNILVIPVPISKKRLKIRGYNQSKIIAKGFCSSCPENTLKLKNNIIYKKINNIPQAKILNRKRRIKNIKNVFGIKNSRIIKKQTIIIIDDVITTGATMKEIEKILKKAGAKNIIKIALAH